MSDFKKVQVLLKQLGETNADKIKVFVEIVKVWGYDFEVEMIEILKGNKLLSTIAQLMEANFTKWKSNFPPLMFDLALRAITYYNEAYLYPISETRPLVAACRKYIMGGYQDVMDLFILVAGFISAKQILFDDNELFDTLKKNLSVSLKAFCCNCVEYHEQWQYKILNDKKLLLDLKSAIGVDPMWTLLSLIAPHPDAKSLMPKEFIVDASKSPSILATFTYCLLCNDNDLASLKLDPAFIGTYTELFKECLATGGAIRGDYNFTLHQLMPPIANLSIAESHKDELGQAFIKLLLKIILDQLPDIAAIRDKLTFCIQEASKALWNLAYLRSNCKLIEEGQGVLRLRNVMVKTSDSIIKQNIAGIIYMCESLTIDKSPPPATTSATSAGPHQKHIMISYNWGNQPTVKRIAQSLKERGYNVWLDLEQMGGSTLEAMANAVEQSELILICMSQKYKDSPNCRLEGEYCVNRKVKFVPLMMQQGYSPDGWLGIALGMKLWFNFADEKDWDSKMDAIVKEIGDLGKGKGKHLSSKPVSAPSIEPAPKLSGKPAINWSDEDLLNWMKQEGIEKHYDAFKEHELDGRALLELKKHLTQHSTFYSFSNFKENMASMGIDKFGQILKISAAVCKLKDG